MNVDFDLTSEEGRRKLIQTFDKWGWGLSPSAWLLKKAYDLTSSLNDETVNSQKETIIETIKAGKKHGVKKMKIIADQTTGLDLASEIEGTPVKIKMGKSGKLLIEVEFK